MSAIAHASIKQESRRLGLCGGTRNGIGYPITYTYRRTFRVHAEVGAVHFAVGVEIRIGIAIFVRPSAKAVERLWEFRRKEFGYFPRQEVVALGQRVVVDQLRMSASASIQCESGRLLSG